MNATVDNSIDELKAIKYTIVSACVVLAHLYACLRIFHKVSSNVSEGKNYSLMTLGFLTAWDIYLCIFNFYSALQMKVTKITSIFVIWNLDIFPLFPRIICLIFHFVFTHRDKVDLINLES